MYVESEMIPKSPMLSYCIQSHRLSVIMFLRMSLNLISLIMKFIIHSYSGDFYGNTSQRAEWDEKKIDKTFYGTFA